MHPYSTILKAVAEGKTIQVLEANVDPDLPSVWIDITADDALADVSDESYAPEDMRVKPDTVVINGYEVMAPVREPLSYGDRYYRISYSKTPVKFIWTNSAEDYNLLDMGVVFLSKESVEAYTKALFNPD